MRIGIYDPYLDDLGGGEKYMMTAAVFLSKKHDVSIFWDGEDDLKMLEKRFSFNFNKISLTQNIFSKNISLWTRLIESKKYDAIIFLSDGSIPFVLSKKLFVHIQQPLDKMNFLSWKNRLKMQRVSAVFQNSQFTASFNERTLSSVKSVVIYPPVDLFSAHVKKENIILNVGRFRVMNVMNKDYKKQQIMVNAFKGMVDRGLQNWKFILATSLKDENNSKFQEMLKSAKGYPVEFVINKTNKELWDLYNKAKIYWHASGFGEDLETHPEYAEHFGISTVEAMGAGAVPVVINAGGQREIVTDSENGFLWDSLEELENKTKNLISNDAMFKKLSSNAKEKAKDFSKEKFCEEINKLISG